MGRFPTIISCEVRRNVQPGGYASSPARIFAERWRQQGCSPLKCRRYDIVLGLMRHFLRQRWSLEQIALTLTCIFAKGHEYRLSYETIYNRITPSPRVSLKRESISTPRQAPSQRVPCCRVQDWCCYTTDNVVAHPVRD